MALFNFLKNKGNKPKTAAQRKAETEAYLKKLNIPFLPHLPLLEEESEFKIRTAQEIAERILVLTYLCYFGEVQEERDEIIDFLKGNKLWGAVSPEEKVLFKKPKLTNRELIDISWRVEAIWLLLWVIQKVDALQLPVEQVTISEMLLLLPELYASPVSFIEDATVRLVTEILDMLDITYRLHWAARDASLNKRPIPGNISLSIVTERHYAANWVTYYADEWDDITTDT